MSQRTTLAMFRMLTTVLLLSGVAHALDSKSPLLVWWPFEEGKGTVVMDHSGNGYDGTVWSKPQWVEGYEGMGLQFDGINDAVFFDFPAAESMDVFTVALWLKCLTLGQESGCAAFASNFPDNAGFQLDVDGGYPGNYRIYPGGLIFGSASRDWVHLTLVVKAAEATLYYDGTQAATGSFSTWGWNEFCLGANRAFDRRWGGTCDDFRVYNRVLGIDQVRALCKGMTLDFLKASTPFPEDGASEVTFPLLRWAPGDGAKSHDVYLGTNPDLVEADRVAVRQSADAYFHLGGLQPGVVYYWRVDEIQGDRLSTVHTGTVWSFRTMPLTGFAPSPADGSDGVFPAPVLSWKAPQNTTSHNVYFGEDRIAVEAGDVATDRGRTAGTTFDAGLLLAGTTYYWRVDETDTSGKVQTGTVWSFTTGQPAKGKIVREWWKGITGLNVALLKSDPRFPHRPTGREWVNRFEGPVNWLENYGSRLYGWLIPPQSGEYAFWIASDDSGELWLSTDADPAHAVRIATVRGRTPPRDFDNVGGGSGGAMQRSASVPLVAGQKYYIEALMKEGGDDDNLSVAWQPPGETRVVIPARHVDTFARVPLRAAAPCPKDRAVDVVPALTLGWFMGEKAVEHDVYFGHEAAAVAAADTSSALYRGRQAGVTWETGDLQWGTPYYWRIDEVATGDPQSPWRGAVWSFTTAGFFSVDDFESYTDEMEAGGAIFQTWIDAVTNGSGALVGYEFPSSGTFAETEIVHGGGQSMPLEYHNTEMPFYSETERTWTNAQDWTINGVETLVLYVRGKANNKPDPLYVVVEDNTGQVAVMVHPDAEAVLATAWQTWQIALADVQAAGVDVAAVRKMIIGVGDRNNPQPGGTGTIYIDDIRLTKRMP